MTDTRLEQLKKCKNRKKLASLLGYKPKSLTYILYQRTSSQNYKTFSIKKRQGGDRVIDAPRSELMLLQRRVSNLLQDCLQDTLAIEGHEATIHHGFQRKKSIITNAKPHRSRKFVFNIDISDYFHSINFGRVLGFFEKNRNFSLEREVAVTLAQICCYNGRLPQGAPTSPVMSNLISQILDVRLSKLAENYGCVYTRYADDITFSTSERKFPRNIAKKSRLSSTWRAAKMLRKEIKSAGFNINPSKTRMQYRQSRQTVTGLVVNSKINVTREYIKDCRAMVNTYIKTGSFFIKRVQREDGGSFKTIEEPGTPAQLIGRYGHIRNVKLSEFSKNNPQPLNLASYEKDYRKLLLFSTFHFNQKPLILVEGKTDSIYLKAALRKLHKDYPTLITKKGKKFEYNIAFFPFTDTTKRMLEIDGGTSHLARFLSAYRKESKGFVEIANQRPVICLIDNDSGAKPFLSWKDKTGAKINNTGSPFNLFGNVYLLMTPIPNGKKESKIEDFFSKNTLATPLGGRLFNAENKAVTESEYGKAWFATKVVWAKKERVNFDKFKPLLNIIAKVASA
jgi:RNA-directed DNA polymerase